MKYSLRALVLSGLFVTAPAYAEEAQKDSKLELAEKLAELWNPQYFLPFAPETVKERAHRLELSLLYRPNRIGPEPSCDENNDECKSIAKKISLEYAEYFAKTENEMAKKLIVESFIEYFSEEEMKKIIKLFSTEEANKFFAVVKNFPDEKISQKLGTFDSIILKEVSKKLSSKPYEEKFYEQTKDLPRTKRKYPPPPPPPPPPTPIFRTPSSTDAKSKNQ